MIELLSPVGDFECLKAAVQNGADAVYFGANTLSARAFASNFDDNDLEKAITYAKLRGVKTNLTLNTLIKNDELSKAIQLAQKAYNYGIDAIIVQDLGLARYLIKNFPDLAVHASTQLSVHNLDGVLKLQEMGFSRVVLSRELSLKEIEYICKNSNIEIEVFVHGALCISYSGQCLFSSMIGGRSGNRGKCAQPCRLPYELISSKDSIIDKGYLLSPRDLCGLDFLPELSKIGVSCLKIEGRMKTPEYVATVTRIYRKYLDNCKGKNGNRPQIAL
ncbi:MAG: peptidase U32 family protein [Clostridia bacterium]